MDGFASFFNIMGRKRWQPFVTWIIRLLKQCIIEGTSNLKDLSIYINSTHLLFSLTHLIIKLFIFNY